MKPVNIEVEIEELVLRGFAPGDRYRISESLEMELHRLFSEEELSPRNFAAEQLDIGSFEIGPDARPEAIGANIARAVSRGCTPLELRSAGRAGRAGTSPAPTRLPATEH